MFKASVSISLLLLLTRLGSSVIYLSKGLGFFKLQWINNASDVWTYRHWLPIRQRRALSWHASFLRYRFILLRLLSKCIMPVLAVRCCGFTKKKNKFWAISLLLFEREDRALLGTIWHALSLSGGGEMISDVYLDYSTYADPPSRLVFFWSQLLFSST